MDLPLSHPGRCPGLRKSGPFGPQSALAPETGFLCWSYQAGRNRRLSGPTARAPSAQPNGLGCGRSSRRAKILCILPSLYGIIVSTKSRLRSLGMRQIPSLDGPLKASRRLSGLVWRPAGCLAKGLRRKA